jgi:hypothetical protein
MIGSKNIVKYLRPNTSNVIMSYGDKSSSKVLGFSKVVITPDVSLVNVISVHKLATMGYATYFDVEFVVVIWSKTLNVAFVGNVKNGLYVVDFSEKPTTTPIC